MEMGFTNQDFRYLLTIAQFFARRLTATENKNPTGMMQELEKYDGSTHLVSELAH